MVLIFLALKLAAKTDSKQFGYIAIYDIFYKAAFKSVIIHRFAKLKQ